MVCIQQTACVYNNHLFLVTNETDFCCGFLVSASDDNAHGFISYSLNVCIHGGQIELQSDKGASSALTLGMKFMNARAWYEDVCSNTNNK